MPTTIPAPTITELLDEIQRLTRYDGQVSLGTMYAMLLDPGRTDRPTTVFSDGEGEPMPYYASLPKWGPLEGVGRTWEEALQRIVDGLRAAEEGKR